MGRIEPTLATKACMCGGTLRVLPDDPALPPHIEHLECNTCEQFYEFDTVTGDLDPDP